MEIIYAYIILALIIILAFVSGFAFGFHSAQKRIYKQLTIKD